MIPRVAPCSPALSPVAVQHLLHRDLGKALRPSSKSMTSFLSPERPFHCFGCNPLALDCHRQTAVLLGLNNALTSAQNKTAPSNGRPSELFWVFTASVYLICRPLGVTNQTVLQRPLTSASYHATILIREATPCSLKRINRAIELLEVGNEEEEGVGGLLLLMHRVSSQWPLFINVMPGRGTNCCYLAFYVGHG